MTPCLTELFQPRDVRSLRLVPLHIVLSVRIAVSWTQAGRDPLPALAMRLSSMEAARAIVDLVHHMDGIWPDPFLVSRPCRPEMSPDEALLGACAGAIERLRFDEAMAGMHGFIPGLFKDDLARHIARAVAAVREAIAQRGTMRETAPVDAPQRRA